MSLGASFYKFFISSGGLTMDELKNCSICGKVYQSNEFINVCPNCVEHEENDFEAIREYLYQHPHASIYEVAQIWLYNK